MTLRKKKMCYEKSSLKSAQKKTRKDQMDHLASMGAKAHLPLTCIKTRVTQTNIYKLLSVSLSIICS